MSDFCKYEKGVKKNDEIFPAIKNCNGRNITDTIEKFNAFNCYYSIVFSSEGNILHIQGETTCDPFTTDIKTVRRRINPSAWGHLNSSSYCDVGKLFYGVFKLWSKLQRKK